MASGTPTAIGAHEKKLPTAYTVSTAVAVSHTNITIAQHMRQVLLDAGQSTITRANVALLDECARRCTHATLTNIPRRERHRRIFLALEVSASFLKKTWRGPSGWRVEYRLLEAEPPSEPDYRCSYCGSIVSGDRKTWDGEGMWCADCEMRVEYFDAEEIESC